MKHNPIILKLLWLLFTAQMIMAQNPLTDIDGDLRIRGKMDLSNSKDSTSLSIGNKSGRTPGGFFIIQDYFNTSLGYKAGYGMFGKSNTFIGAQSGNNPVNPVNKGIAIGYGAKVGCSNCAVIGGTGSNAVKVGIGTSSPSKELDIHGDIKINGTGKGIYFADNSMQTTAYTGAGLFYRHAWTCDVGPTTSKSCGVLCEEGDVVTGGGWDAYRTVSGIKDLNSNTFYNKPIHPEINGKQTGGWEVGFRNNSGSAYTVRVYCICADVN